MAHIRNIARDVVTGSPFLTGSADIFGPDGVLLSSVPVNGSSGVWEFKQNGSPGAVLQEYAAAGQTKRVDGSLGGQVGPLFELELPRLLQLFGSGVITGMTVTAPGGMNVQVQTGDLLNLGAQHAIHTPETVAIATAHPTLPRIDIVASELQRAGTFAGRLRLVRVAGTPAASPVAPTLTQDANINQVEVCRVTVPAAASSIILSNISIADRPIATGPLSDGSVTQAKLAKPSVGTPELFDAAVTLAKLAAEVESAYRRSPGLISTYWVTMGGVPDQIDFFTISQNTLYATPIHIPRATTLTGLAVRISTSPGSSITMRLGLYKVGSNGLPSTLHHDAGTITTSGAGIQSKTGLSVSLPAGWYQGAACFGSFSGSFQLYGRSSPEGLGVFGGPTIGSTSALWSSLAGFSGTGALPATFPAPGLSADGPLVWLQTAGS